VPAETHSTHEPITADEVFTIIRGQLAEILEIDESRITMDSKFADDLDADSLALIELVEALEEELGERTVGFSVDDEDLGDLASVRDAVDYVVSRLGGTAA
jgi:acyl carrier protein